MADHKDLINNADNAINGIKSAMEPIAKLSSVTAKTSITRLTKDQVFQFPIIMDADIDDDEKYPIIKSLEKNYAQIVMLAITNEGHVDRDKLDNINKFLRKFHNNTDLPFDAFNNASESMIDAEVTSAVAYEGYLSENELIDMWDCVEEQLDSESINSMYLPYQRTVAKLSRAVEAANESIAIEAEDKYFRREVYKKDKNGNFIVDKASGSKILDTDDKGNTKYEYFLASDETDKNDTFKNLENKYGAPKSMRDWKKYDSFLEDEKEARRDEKDRERDKSTAYSKIRGDVVKDDKFSNLSPTILKLTIANTRKGAAWAQDIIIGIKTMPRFLRQSLIVANMIEAFKDRAIFKFIKWTKGELKLIDILFGYSEAKNNAIANSDSKWLKILRKRAKKAKGFRMGGYKLNPNTTIIITSADAHMIYEKCGVNPNNVENVKKIMDKYFLLAFGIYDTDAKMLNIIYDGESEFSHQSLRSMIAESKKDANLLAMNKY